MVLDTFNGIKYKEIALKSEDNPIVFLDLKIGDEEVGRIIIELFKHAVPSTAENFRALCTGETTNEEGKQLIYKNSFFHKIIPHFMFQGGDIVNYDGSSGYSIYGPKFELENFVVPHDEPGILSTVTTEDIFCNSQFIITSTDCPHLNGRSVAFGRVVRGFSCVQEMGTVKTINEVPEVTCQIQDCGQLNSLNDVRAYPADLDDGLPHGPNDLVLLSHQLMAIDLKKISQVIISIAKSYFEKKNFVSANHQFRKALRYLEWLLDQLSNLTLTEEEHNEIKKQFQDEVHKTNLNLAATAIELGDGKKCDYYCDQVLSSEKNNVKALYRKGKALFILKDYDGALRVQKRALKLKPADTCIKKAIQDILQKKASYLIEEKRAFSKMFDFSH